MRDNTTIVFVVMIFAILTWLLLKDKEEVVLVLSLPGVGQVGAKGISHSILP